MDSIKKIRKDFGTTTKSFCLSAKIYGEFLRYVEKNELAIGVTIDGALLGIMKGEQSKPVASIAKRKESELEACPQCHGAYYPDEGCRRCNAKKEF